LLEDHELNATIIPALPEVWPSDFSNVDSGLA